MIRPITVLEVRESIKHLKSNKSPGSDGLSGEFYKYSIEELSPKLTKVLNYTISEGDPPKTWSEAIISVLHKEVKGVIE